MSNTAISIHQLLDTIDAQKRDLDAMSPMRLEDMERLWKKFRLEWNYNSNHLEGNTLTYRETELILIFDQAPTAAPHTVREIEEMKAHDVAVKMVRDWAADEERELSEADIRDLNRILLVRPFWKDALTTDLQPTRRLISIGEYKQQPNSVRLPNGEMFHFASPEETPLRMAALLDWYRQARGIEHPVKAAAKLHYDFVRIHPFDDGNGRVARLLTNYHLLRQGFPPIVIQSADKQQYLFALQRADVGDFDAFVAYIGQQLKWSLELAMRAAKGESVEEMGDWEKELAILGKQQQGEKKVSAKSGQLIYKRLEDSINPLIESLSNKLGLTTPLFDKQERHFDFRLNSNYYQSPPQDYDLLIDELLNRDQLQDLSSIELYFRLFGFLADPSPERDIVILIKISFGNYQYQIEFLNSPILVKNYLVPIDPNEANQVIEIIGKHLLEKIKNGH